MSEPIKGTVMQDKVTKQSLFKTTLLSKVFNKSNLMQDALTKDSQFVLSDNYPTQVINIHGDRYYRINYKDINYETINDLVTLMLSIDSLKEDDDYQDTLQKALKRAKQYDMVDVTQHGLVEVNNVNQITNLDAIPIKPQKIAKTKEDAEKLEKEKKEEKEEEDTESFNKSLKKTVSKAGATDTTKSSSKSSKKTISVEMQKDIEQEMIEVESLPSKTSFQRSKSILNVSEIAELHKMSKKLLKAFKGTKGKTLGLVPTKRLNSKAIGMDKDKVYVTKKQGQGKHITLNFLIDMSGSMSGSPIKNAVKLVYLFNLLAKEEYVTMNVLYSSSKTHYVLKLPANEAEILSLSRVSSSEGLANTCKRNVDILKNKKLICITDGCITDEPIKKSFWSKNKIVSTGIYVNSSVKLENLHTYSDGLTRWFNHSLVRNTLPELIETLVRIGIKN